MSCHKIDGLRENRRQVPFEAARRRLRGPRAPDSAPRHLNRTADVVPRLGSGVPNALVAAAKSSHLTAGMETIRPARAIPHGCFASSRAWTSLRARPAMSCACTPVFAQLSPAPARRRLEPRSKNIAVR